MAKVVRGWISADRADSLATRILSDPPPRLDVRGHRVGDAFYCRRVVPELLSLMDAARSEASDALGVEVFPSPWFRSAVSVKVYEPGSRHEWHYDSNPVTALLVLAGESEQARTVLEVDGIETPIENGPGGLLVMDGNLLRHCVHTIPEDHPPRITIPYNLYLSADSDRPEGQDELVYGRG